MPTFGTTLVPVRTHPDHPININSPDGFMMEPPGDLWWIGFHEWWQAALPAAVTRATSIIVNPLVRMPWLLTNPAGQTIAPTDPGYPAWLKDPMLLNGSSGGANLGHYHMLDRRDRFDLWASWIRDALQLGMGLLAFRLDSDGQPLTGSVRRDSPFNLYRDVDGWVYGDGRPVNPDGTVRDDDGLLWRLLPLRHSIPDGVFGRHRAQLDLASRITSYADESLNSNTPSGILTTEQPINQTQSDNAREEWERTINRRRIAVLGNGARYQQVVMSPVEAELVAMARLSNEQVAHMFELAAWHLDASTNSMTYSNAQDNRQDLVDGPLASWSARVEETVGALLPWGWAMHIDFTRYTTPTTPQGPANGNPVPAGE